MILKKVKVFAGNMQMETNVYVVIDEETKKAMIIDPAGNVDEIMKILQYNEATVEYIVLTHCHADHFGAVKELREKCNTKLCIHKLDADGLKDVLKSLAEYVQVPNADILADILLEEDNVLNVGNLKFKIIHTPGHTVGSICIYSEGILFSGDTLFRGAWGRTDLPGSDFEQIIESIDNKLMILPDETIVYPGHGRPTIIKDEKKIYLELKRF